MKTKKENSVLLLLKWAEKDRGYLIASVICAFLGGLLAIGPYIGIYRLMDAFLTDTCSIRVISENAVLITATVIIRQVFQGLSGIFSHKGAYGALFRVRCMITEHLSKVPLGALDERRTGDIKTVLNEDGENGVLSSDSITEWADNLISILKNPAVLIKMRSSARTTALLYDEKSIANQILESYAYLKKSYEAEHWLMMHLNRTSYPVLAKEY